MTTTTTSHFCRADTQLGTLDVSAEGGYVACPTCGKDYFLSHSDAYYQDHYPTDLAAYILYRRRTREIQNIGSDLARIRYCRQWLKGQRLDLVSADYDDLEAFFADMNQHLPQRKTTELKKTISHYYDVLAQEGVISISPLAGT